MMMCDAHPSGIAPPTIPFAAPFRVWCLALTRPSGGSFTGKVKERVRSTTEHVAHCASQAVVGGERAQALAQVTMGLLRGQSVGVAGPCKGKHVAAFEFVKHSVASDPASQPAQKMVNLPLMGSAHA